jgi:hypothetical protein
VALTGTTTWAWIFFFREWTIRPVLPVGAPFRRTPAATKGWVAPGTVFVCAARRCRASSYKGGVSLGEVPIEPGQPNHIKLVKVRLARRQDSKGGRFRECL